MGSHTYAGPKGADMKYAILFPGQGAQKVGMCADYASDPTFRKIFSQAKDVLGYDLWQIIASGPVDTLNRTEITQPALLACSVALWEKALQTQAIHPDAIVAMAGHSLGEYSALVCAGVLDFEVALSLVSTRGRLMQEAVPAGEGAMMALLGVNRAQSDVLCQGFCEQDPTFYVVSANINTPLQVVVSGHKKDVLAFGEYVKDKGVRRAILLPVSVPSHCALMQPAADALAPLLAKATFHRSRFPIVTNVRACPYTDPAELQKQLIQQLTQPVLWQDTITYLIKEEVQRMIECGPSMVLQGLNKAIDPQLTTNNITAFFDQRIAEGENSVG
jgi:[acyl-carrier-protein] S-malonyltransferase